VPIGTKLCWRDVKKVRLKNISYCLDIAKNMASMSNSYFLLAVTLDGHNVMDNIKMRNNASARHLVTKAEMTFGLM
jgi:hypothetical protein